MLLNSSCILCSVSGSELEASLSMLKSKICQALGVKDTVATEFTLCCNQEDQGRKRVVIILLYVSLYNEIYIII